MNFGTNLFGESVLRRAAHFPQPDIRRSLSRDWSDGPRALVIGCNPSNAGADREDPTTQWWNQWFSNYGFGGYDAMNLWARVSSDPAECRRWADWQSNGPDWYARDEIHNNLTELVAKAKTAHQVFVCWGNIAWDHDWIAHVVQHIQEDEAPWPDLWCWGKTKSGAPTHPMARGKYRIARDQAPILWKEGSL